MSKSEIIARDVVRIPTGIANAYIIGSPDNWVLIDAGTPGNKANILSAVTEHMGANATPRAIVLTHGHFDHSGSASALAEHWGVSIYAHRRELPFVDGRSAYPPPDPTVGGFMSQVIRFIPNSKINLRPHLRELQVGPLLWLRHWQVIETPGHTAGHVSFFREQDGALIAGDAFTTMNQDSMLGTLSRKQEVWRPPTYYTPDWQQARKSVAKLAALGPRVLAAGHGVPMSGWGALEQLRQLATHFPIPERGRYVNESVRYYEGGIAYLPPPVPDTVKRTAVITTAAAATLGAGLWLAKRRSAEEPGGLERKPAA